jgi:hypothetical protein
MELKPCPFCGAAAKESTGISLTLEPGILLHCEGASCSNDECALYWPISHRGRNEIWLSIKQWNQRYAEETVIGVPTTEVEIKFPKNG